MRPARPALSWPGCCTAWGVSCQVIAPSLIPKAPGDRVKTDKRDCRRLARLHRASELVAIRIPSPTEEAVRDLCRTRADMVEDRMRARHRLSKFLLRHGRVWRDGKAWTLAHERWLCTQHFAEESLQTTYDHYRVSGGAGKPRRAAWRSIAPGSLGHRVGRQG
jgi:transposase